jgi:hypothetical protein
MLTTPTLYFLICGGGEGRRTNNGKRLAAAIEKTYNHPLFPFSCGRTQGKKKFMEKNSPSKPRRAAKACSFCRRRKVGKLSSS